VFKSSDHKNNIYLLTIEKILAQDKDPSNILWQTFVQSRTTFLNKMVQTDKAQSLLNAAGPLVLTEDFHMTSPIMWQHQSQSLPWWIDLVRFETGMRLVAKNESLKTFNLGACVDSYTKTLLNTDLPFARSAEKTATQKILQETWNDLLPLKNPRLQSALRELFKEQGLSLKSLRTSLLKFSPEVFVAKTDDDSFWLVKWQDYKNSPVAEGSCATLVLARNIKGVKNSFHCFKVAEGETLSIEKISSLVIFTSFDKSKTETDLIFESEKQCQEIAIWHAKQWTPFEIKSLAFSLNTNPTLKNRILKTAEREAEEIDRAYRMWLEQQKDPR